MSRIQDRQKAISLRKRGNTYSEIKRRVGVSKSTLSGWLKNYPLTEKQFALLENNKKNKRELSIEKIRITKSTKKQNRLSQIYNEQQKRWLPLNDRELELAGLFLYWGEGGKVVSGSVSLNNTDPQVLKFTLFWLVNGLKIPRKKIKVFLHLYNDMDINREMKYWSKELKLPLSQFSRPYIKESSRSQVEHKGYGHGTCGLSVNDTRLKEKIMLSIKAIADYYSEKI